MDIFKLVGSVFVDTEEANKSLAKTDEKAEGVGKTLLNGAAKAGKFAIGLTAGCASAAAGMVKLASDSAGTADVIDKASQRMNISAESYQELAHAAELSGVEMSTMEKAAKKLEGTDLSLDDALAQIYEFGTAEERSAKAAEIFGDSIAYTLSPMLNASAEEMAAMRQEANELGLVMSGDNVKAGAKLNDTLNNLKNSFGALVTKLGTSFMPIIQKIADMIIDNLPKIQSLFDELAPILTDMLEEILPPLIDLAEEIFPIILNLIKELLPFVTNLVSNVMPVLIEILDALTPILDVLIELLKPILELFMDLLKPILDLATMALKPLVTILTEFLKMILEPMIPAIEKLSSIISTVLSKAFDDISAKVEFAKEVFKGISEFISGIFSSDWESAWNGVVDIFARVFTSIVAIAKKPLNTIISGVNAVFDKIGSIKIPDWVPGLGGSSFSLPQIPMLAKGGDIQQGGTVLVGENGPEFLNLPRGARVTPLADGTGIDYDKMTESFVRAISIMLPQLQNAYRIVPDSNNIFRLVQDEAKIWENTTGYPAF